MSQNSNSLLNTILNLDSLTDTTKHMCLQLLDINLNTFTD